MFFNRRKRYNSDVTSLLPAFDIDIEEAGFFKLMETVDIAWENKFSVHEAVLLIAFSFASGLYQHGLVEKANALVKDTLPPFQEDWIKKGLVRPKFVSICFENLRKQVEEMEKTTAGPLVPSLSQTWLDEAVALEKAQDWRSQDWQVLLDHCRCWTQVEPGNYLAWYWLGKTSRRMGLYPLLLEASREMLRLKPDDARSWDLLGCAYNGLGRHQEAIDAFREYLRISPNDFDIWRWLGIAYSREELGLYSEAVEAYREALRIRPDDAYTWWLLGKIYERLSRYPEAIEAYREGLRIEPGYAEGWLNLSYKYKKLGRHGEAIEAYREALRIEPDNVMVWGLLGLSYKKLGCHNEAMEAYREALRIEPDDRDDSLDWLFLSDAYKSLGRSQEKLGRYPEAIEAYREALRIEPNCAQAWYGLGVVYINSGNRSAALEAARELRRLDTKKAEELLSMINKQKIGVMSFFKKAVGKYIKGNKYDLIRQLSKKRLKNNAYLKMLIGDPEEFIDNLSDDELMGLPEANLVSIVEIYTTWKSYGKKDAEIFKAIEKGRAFVNDVFGDIGINLPSPLSLSNYVKYRIDKDSDPHNPKPDEKFINEAIKEALDFFRYVE